MFHMLSCFNLKPGGDIAEFQQAYSAFFDEMKSIDLVESTGPLGRRENNTPMDTDDERDHEYFVVMSFRDRPQVDAAYAYIKQHVEPGDKAHHTMYSNVRDPIFVCWQDL